MKGVLLGAGRGSRLGRLTIDRPKCMVELAGQPLISWQVRSLRAAGIDDLAVVHGYKGDRIKCSNVEFIANPRWETTNMVYLFLQLENGCTTVQL